MPLPELDPAVGGRHVLALPPEGGPDVVEILARSRFPRAAWEAADAVASGSARGAAPSGTATLRAAAAAAASSGGRRATSDLESSVPRALRLSRHSRLIGPYGVGRGTSTELGLPVGFAYLVDAPVERGARPTPLGGDRLGLRRAFPGGLPIRDEERVLQWALDVARRLGGVVRVAERDGTPGVLLAPEPTAAVDLTVWSDIWLDPDTAIAVMRQALPRAYLNLPSGRWYGPPPGTGERVVPGTEVLTGEQRSMLHAAADEFDRAAMAEPVPMTAFGALADLELDGMIALEVSGEETPPPVVGSLPWAARGAVAYRVRWEPADLADAEQERPSPMHRVARGRAAPLVVAVARAVHGAVGGELTDMMDFVVDPTDL